VAEERGKMQERKQAARIEIDTAPCEEVRTETGRKRKRERERERRGGEGENRRKTAR
jgi:hypothetical protein